ncbi:MAG: FtsX-like permease family protein [Chloroflexi bacterium]|nr:FtsX-like permease family protein [Chloroflexota bacterium]
MKMNKLERKLIRDLWSSKGLFIAVTIIIFLAVAFFGAMFMAYQNLNDSYDYSYEKLRFADFTVKVSQDALEAIDELEKIEGVETVTGRMNAEDIALTLPDTQTKKVSARVISLPSSDTARADVVNDVLVEEGNYFLNNEGLSLLVEKNFADHHELKPGQMVHLTLEEEDIGFGIAGIVASPEYIFPAESRQNFMPSSEVWGVVFVPEDIITLLKRPVNEFCFLIKDGADYDSIITEVETILDQYQVMDIVPREDQPSYTGLEMDLEQFATLAELFPLLFIIVGAMATYILLTRIVYNQRPQIGLMRATGYSRRQVMVHYLGFALFIGLVGSIAGIIVGHFLSEGITHFYASMINLPYTTMEIQWISIGGGIILGLLPCIISGIIPAFTASRILPAEAMRTPTPSAGRKLLIEKMFPFLTRLSSVWKIPLRNIFRNRRRSIYTAIGVTFGVSLILVSAIMIDSMVDLIDFQFNKIQRYDARVQFSEEQPASLVDEFAGWDGVEKAEPLLEIPVRLENGEKSYSTLLVALPSDTELRGIYSPSRERIAVSNEGIMLTEALSDTLDVDKGDTLTLWGSEQLEVVGFVKDPMGSFGYVSLELAQSMAGMDVISGMLLEVNPEYEDIIRDKAYKAGAASVELSSETKESVDKMMESGMVMLYIMLLFGATLALAIVFTTVTVNILERRREIATMRTLGESKGRIVAMITIENLLLGMVALIPGIVLGYVLAWYFFSLFQGDMFSMDLVVFPRTYVMTIGIVVLIMLISQVPGIRSINRLNLAQVTKEQAS